MARIAVFSLTFHPFVGGAEVAVERIAAKLQATHQFTVFTVRLQPNLPPRETVGAVTVVRVGNGTRWDKYRYPWLAPAAARAEYDRAPFQLIWGMMASWGGWAALRFKERNPAVPYVLTEQSGDSDAFIARRTWFWRRRYRQIYTRANAVTAISQFLAERAKRFGASAVTVVPNGVDVERFSRPAGGSDWQKFRAREQLTKGPVVITVSRLVHKNGIDDLIAAIGLLRQRGVTITLWIVGTGPLASSLQSRVKELDLDAAVQFKGFIAHDELPRLLQSALLFVRPSRSEGFGNAIVEAMAAGVPVVVTPVGGIPDFVHHEVTGLFCRPNDPESIAVAIERLVQDEALRQRLAANARRLVRERYDWSIIARQMNQVLAAVMPKR